MCNINDPIGGNYMKTSKEKVKKSLVRFATSVADRYNESLGCFTSDKEDLIEDFEDLIDMLQDYKDVDMPRRSRNHE